MKRFNDINTEPMAGRTAPRPKPPSRTLMSEIDRWAPIIKAAGEYAD